MVMYANICIIHLIDKICIIVIQKDWISTDSTRLSWHKLYLHNFEIRPILIQVCLEDAVASISWI